MGYDCTFHLIDENAIHDEFVPKLLEHTTQETHFDRVRPDAAELWLSARRALREGVDADRTILSPHEVASLVCTLAVRYSACSLPHHYERGIALSLWPDDLDPIPSDFAHSPEPLFAEVVKEYPPLKGQFPTRFTENFATGYYVPTGKVGEVRAWVESTIAKLNKGEQRLYRGLIGVLKTAEARNFAFWEATDLAIAIANVWPGDPGLMTAEFLHNVVHETGVAEKFKLPTEQRWDWKGGCGAVGVFSSLLPKNIATDTLVLDLSQWPPACHVRRAEYTWKADGDRCGRWLLLQGVSVNDQANPLRRMFYTDLRKAPESIVEIRPRSFLSTLTMGILGSQHFPIYHGILVDGRALLVPNPDRFAEGTALQAWFPQGDRMIPAPGLPAHRVSKLNRWSNEPMICDIARLADGKEVLTWEGDGYEWNGSHFVNTFPLKRTRLPYEYFAVPAGQDGFFYLNDWQLYEAHRGQAPARHGRKWTNVMAVMPGPQNGLLLKEGDSPDGDIGKLYFPADGTFIPIEPEMFGDHDVYDFLLWSEKTARIIASDSVELYAVPVATVLNLQRHSVATGRKVK